ncbi:MAG: ABC transporter ATP-binding protein [Bacteroidales bacterium]|nr:ABC transporter ATP-binding protein [Bacteroidales bacterium]
MRKLSECIKALWGMSATLRWRLVVSIAIGLVRIAVSLSFVWASKHLVDIATKVSDDSMGHGIAIFIGILVLQIASIVFGNWWFNYNRVKAQNHMREQLFGHVLRSRWAGRERYLSGDVVNRLEDDIRISADLLVDSFPSVVITLTQLIAASVYLMTLAPNLLWVLIILMVAAVVGSRMFFKQLRRLMARIRERDAEVQQLMQESFQHRVLMLTLTGVERVMERFGWLQTDIEDLTRKRLNYNAMARGFMLFGFQAGHAAAFLWGVFGIAAGTVTYGMMTAFLQLVGQVQRPVADLGSQITALIRAVTSIDRLMDLEELEEEPDVEPIVLPGAPEVAVANLTFSYPDLRKPVLKDFSCTFAAGSFNVIAGPTGVGKSTLINLILGLLQPSAGTVTVGGQTAGAALRSNFMYVPQGNSLLSGTIRSNLLLASPSAGEQEMREALETAEAGFVYDLPEGLDTPCGESGSGLSEGQAQRIAIARALLRPGGILILDESTSALDPATEARMLENIHSRNHGQKTIIFISHREAVVRFADSVVEIPE